MAHAQRPSDQSELNTSSKPCPWIVVKRTLALLNFCCTLYVCACVWVCVVCVCWLAGYCVAALLGKDRRQPPNYAAAAAAAGGEVPSASASLDGVGPVTPRVYSANVLVALVCCNIVYFFMILNSLSVP